MSTTSRTVTALAGLACMLALTGCPKKAVLTPSPLPGSETVAPERTSEFVLSLGTIHFDFDKSDIRPRDGTTLQGNYGQVQKAVGEGLKPAITIEGYCDPIGTLEYNMALGMRRAEAAKSYLVKLGASTNTFSTTSYGEERLVTTDPAKYELNRRCEFKIAE